jgi:hypothetical protein
VKEKVLEIVEHLLGQRDPVKQLVEFSADLQTWGGYRRRQHGFVTYLRSWKPVMISMGVAVNCSRIVEVTIKIVELRRIFVTTVIMMINTLREVRNLKGVLWSKSMESI